MGYVDNCQAKSSVEGVSWNISRKEYVFSNGLNTISARDCKDAVPIDVELGASDSFRIMTIPVDDGQSYNFLILCAAECKLCIQKTLVK